VNLDLLAGKGTGTFGLGLLILSKSDFGESDNGKCMSLLLLLLLLLLILLLLLLETVVVIVVVVVVGPSGKNW